MDTLLAPSADPIALAEAAYARSLAEYEAYLRGSFVEQFTCAVTLSVLADAAEARALPFSSKTARA